MDEKEKNDRILTGYILDITSYTENGYTVKATLSPKTSNRKNIRYLTNETEKLYKTRQNYTGPNNIILDFIKTII